MAPATQPQPERPQLNGRLDYERARGSTEAFIVPLLANAIRQRLSTLPPGAGRAALDVGCGRQPLRAEIERLGYHYTGLDMQQDSLRPVDVIAPIDAPAPPELIARGPFAFILCTEVLEHVADWDAAFANFARLLGPGGRVLLTCPHLYPPHEVPYDFWRPTEHAIGYWAGRHGLTLRSAERLGSGWDVLGTLLACVNPSPTGSARWRPGAVCFRAARRAVVGLLRRGIPQRLVTLDTRICLSVLAELEKP